MGRTHQGKRAKTFSLSYHIADFLDNLDNATEFVEFAIACQDENLLRLMKEICDAKSNFLESRLIEVSTRNRAKERADKFEASERRRLIKRNKELEVAKKEISDMAKKGHPDDDILKTTISKHRDIETEIKMLFRRDTFKMLLTALRENR